MSREVLEILEKMDKKELKTQLALQCASRYVVNALFAPNIIILRVYDIVSFYIDQI